MTEPRTLMPGPNRLFAAVLAAALPFMGVDCARAASLEETLRQARAAAQSDRNAESAALFEKALALAPERRAELLREFADQLVYSGRSAQAVPLYRERLASELPAEERHRALRGLGLALAWSDRPGESRAVYESLLREIPGDAEAQRGVARGMAWSGRQREAQAELRRQLSSRPDDAEARVQLAQSQWWLGRPDEARRTLSGLDAAGESRGEARTLRREMDEGLAPRTSLRAQRSTQSDSLEIHAVALEHHLILREGLLTVMPRLETLRYEPRERHREVRVIRPGVHARQRFGDDWELNVDAALDTIEPQAAPRYRRFTHATWLTFWPQDSLRFDASAKRVTFDNVTSLERRITASFAGVSMDFTPDERDRITLRADRGRYSDGNRRTQAQVELERRVRAHPRVWAGARYTHFDFRHVTDSGYFNPRRYDGVLATLRVENAPASTPGRWTYSAFAAAGAEDARPGDSKPIWEGGVRAGYRFHDRAQLEVRLQRFSSRTASLSGFARTTSGVQLNLTW
jgi:thioredoxin-like negative regulator of GroEL